MMKQIFKTIMFGILVCAATSVWAAPFQKGETITYTIKQFGISAGQAQLIFKGEAVVEGQTYIWLRFEAKGFKFEDKEDIYLNPQSYLPMLVKREVDYLGKHELIEERYDHTAGMVTITKTVGKETTQEILEKPGPIDNIYGFIYRYRLNGTFKVGQALDISLPTMDLNLKIAKKDLLKAGGKKFDTFFLESNPSKYKIWFSNTDQKIPLRISGAVGVANTTMIMDEYSAQGAM